MELELNFRTWSLDSLTTRIACCIGAPTRMTHLIWILWIAAWATLIIRLRDHARVAFKVLAWYLGSVSNVWLIAKSSAFVARNISICAFIFHKTRAIGHSWRWQKLISSLASASDHDHQKDYVSHVLIIPIFIGEMC